MAQKCKDEIATLPDDKKKEPEEGFCPNHCSGNGKCVKGKCNCNNGWIEEDCSRPVGKNLYMPSNHIFMKSCS